MKSLKKYQVKQINLGMEMSSSMLIQTRTIKIWVSSVLVLFVEFSPIGSLNFNGTTKVSKAFLASPMEKKCFYFWSESANFLGFRKIPAS